MIRQKQKSKKLIVDLTGPCGNAYYLIGLANKLTKGMPSSIIEDITKEMTSSSYENLIKVFDKHFGDKVILEI